MAQLTAKLMAKFAAKSVVVQYTNVRLVVSRAFAMPAVNGPCPGPRSLATVRAERAEMSEMHWSTPRR
jgi:hypothetical protein